MLHCNQIAVRHIATKLAGCLLRSNMNGSFRECGKAAYDGVERPLRAGSRLAWVGWAACLGLCDLGLQFDLDLYLCLPKATVEETMIGSYMRLLSCHCQPEQYQQDA